MLTVSCRLVPIKTNKTTLAIAKKFMAEYRCTSLKIGSNLLQSWSAQQIISEVPFIENEGTRLMCYRLLGAFLIKQIPLWFVISVHNSSLPHVDTR